MKAIGVLTFQHTINFGAALQMYALQETIKKMGHSSEVIQYMNPTIEEREFPTASKSENWSRYLVKLVKIFLERKKRNKFNDFVSKYIQLSEEKYDSSNISSISQKYEKVIVGSDQVWHPSLTGKDLNYFLPFHWEHTQKYAYAASYGTDKIDGEWFAQLSPLLTDFNIITCREESGKKITDEAVGRDSKVVLDPTFLVTKEEWLTFSRKSSLKLPQKYLLLYFVKNKQQLHFAKSYAKEQNLEILYLSLKPYSGRGIRTISDASPVDFINLIANAEAVIAGSYHGYILSLNLNKKILVALDSGSSNNNSRMQTMIDMFGIKDSIFDATRDKHVFFDDYAGFNEKLDIARDQSLLALKQILM